MDTNTPTNEVRGTPMGQMGLDARAQLRQEMLDKLVERIKAPEVEARKAASFALDTHWSDGLTVPQWAHAVAQALNIEMNGDEFGEQEPRAQPTPQPVPQQNPQPPGAAPEPPQEEKPEEKPEEPEEEAHTADRREEAGHATASRKAKHKIRG